MAKVMAALYDDEHTAQWVVHELKQVGVSRHDVDVVTDDAVSAYERFTGQKPARKGYILVAAWVMTVFEKQARRVFMEHKPAAFYERVQHQRGAGLFRAS